MRAAACNLIYNNLQHAFVMETPSCHYLTILRASLVAMPVCLLYLDNVSTSQHHGPLLAFSLDPNMVQNSSHAKITNGFQFFL